MKITELKSKFLIFDILSYADYADENLLLLWKSSNFTRMLLRKNFVLTKRFFIKDPDNSKKFLVIGEHFN